MKRAFTLVELLIVMAILAIMVTMMIGILNPKALVDRAFDARKKKDLSRIKVAFEEYYNDKGCYPTTAVIDSLACDGDGFSQWGLSSWPCDPVTRVPYYIFAEQKSCPSWYKILTNLNNKIDLQIPTGWYQLPNSGYSFGDGTVSSSQVNFGVSSPNVSWFDQELALDCNAGGPQCFGYDGVTYVWTPLGLGQHYCNVYTLPNLLCLVGCCYNGSVCSDGYSCP